MSTTHLPKFFIGAFYVFWFAGYLNLVSREAIYYTDLILKHASPMYKTIHNITAN